MARKIDTATRKNVIWACEIGMPFTWIADYYKVSTRSVRRWYERWKHNVRAVEDIDIFDNTKKVWRIVDNQKLTTVGKVYATEQEAKDALYAFL